MLVDCSAMYYENIEYEIANKFIDQSVITLENVMYKYFRLGWEKLPETIDGYGDLSI